MLCRGRGCSSGGSELCGQLGVDKVLDGSDLDVISRAEREDENRFVGERAARAIAVKPRL
jgi:hypothetical protein